MENVTVLVNENTKYGTLTYSNKTSKFYLDSKKSSYGSFLASEISEEFIYKFFAGAGWFGGEWGYAPSFDSVKEQVEELIQKIKII